MLYSMTGFGRAELQTAERKLSVEMKSVNHRYFECSVKAPKKYSLFESRIRRLLKDYALRGKIDVYISSEEDPGESNALEFHQELAAKYVSYAKQMADQFHIPNDLTVTALMRCPDVLTMSESSADAEELWSDLEKVLREAAEKFQTMRQQEGELLKKDLEEKLDGLAQNVEKVIRRSPDILEEYKERLREKTRELLADAQIEESRIAAEVILFADKICTDEETVRLKSHIQHMRETLSAGEGVGRKLDFLAQEMNREANTILSKSNDQEVSEIAVELKTEIEKIREQIQNIE